MPEDSFSSVPDGTITIWNYMLPKKPEYVLESQSMITSARFHPTNPKLVVAATISGQILAWDIRAKMTPHYRTQFSAGHSAPVFAMEFLPTHNRNMQHILTVSNDAKLCMWNDDFLVKPSV